MKFMNSLRLGAFVAITSCVLVFSEYSASAESVTPLTQMWKVNDQTTIESFETIAGRGEDQQILGSLTLPCGAVVTNNYPYHDSSTPYIVNGGFFGLSPASPYCPDGSAYLGQGNPGMLDSGIWITFPEVAMKVGAYVCSANEPDSQAPVVLEAYDAAGNLLGDMMLRNIDYTEWATSFRGFESKTGIKTIRYDGYGEGVLRIDALAYQVVPEPGSLSLLFFGFLMLLLCRKKR